MGSNGWQSRGPVKKMKDHQGECTFKKEGRKMIGNCTLKKEGRTIIENCTFKEEGKKMEGNCCCLCSCLLSCYCLIDTIELNRRVKCSPSILVKLQMI